VISFASVHLFVFSDCVATVFFNKFAWVLPPGNYLLSFPDLLNLPHQEHAISL